MYACNNYNEIFNNIVSLFTIMCVCSMYPVFIHMFSEIDNLKSKLTKQVLVDDIIVCNKQPTKDIKSDATENNIEDTEKVAYDKLILNKELLKGLGKFEAKLRKLKYNKFGVVSQKYIDKLNDKARRWSDPEKYRKIAKDSRERMRTLNA